MKNTIYTLLFFVFCTASMLGQSYSDVSDVPHPKDNGDSFISDPQDYLSESVSQEIDEIITEIRDEKGFEIAVVIVSSINNQATLPFATDLGYLWGVGKGDRGIVILIAVEDREMAIATGYETEQYIPDLITARVREEEMTPHFKLEDYDAGVYQGVLTLRNIIMDENVPFYVEEEKEKHNNIILWEWFAIGATLLLLLLTILVSPNIKTVIRSLIIVAIAFIISAGSYFFILKAFHTKDIIWDAFAVLSFIAIAINTFLVLKEDTKKIWAYAVFFCLAIPIPLLGLYLYGWKSIVIVYLVGTGLVFGIFLLLYLISLVQKDPYNKYHTILLFKFDVFSYIFPLPMYVVDMIVENLMESWRERVRFSKKTGLEMRKLSEVEDDKYLKSGQITEEKIKSVDYDVWISEEKDDFIILKYKTWFSKYSSCPQCTYKTWYLVYDKVIRAATYSSSGTGQKKKACAHCKHSDITTYTIPQKVRSSSSSSGGGSWSSGGGGGSFGGGSFGGGGSSGGW